MAAQSAHQAHLRLVSAPVATPTESADLVIDRPLKVCIRPYQLDFWEYEGTRAQLEAEGVIPPDTKWPEGAQDLRFDVGRFRYWLRRTRPDGVKGPMKVWTSGDWWCLRCDLIDGPDMAARRIQDKKRELVDELYRQSPAGRHEWSVQWNAAYKARQDTAYQAFKNLIPGLVPPKRGRKPKSQATQGAQQ